MIATADLKGLRNRVGTLGLTKGEAVFFSRRWGRLVACQTGKLRATETSKGFLLGELVLIAADGPKACPLNGQT